MRVGPRPIKECPRLLKKKLPPPWLGRCARGRGARSVGFVVVRLWGSLVGGGWRFFLVGGAWCGPKVARPPPPSLRSPSGSFVCRGYQVFVRRSAASGLRSGIRLGFFGI